MPLIADPGRAARARGARRGLPRSTVLPGPSAVETALVASRPRGRGLRVPRLGAARRGRSAGASSPRRAAAALPSVVFESPRRLAATLADLARLAPEHPLAVARELTKLHEEVLRGSARRGRRARRARARARSASCSRRRREPSAARPRPRRSTRCASWSRRACRRGRRASSWPRLTGSPRRALYDAAVAERPRPMTALMPRPGEPYYVTTPIYYVNAEPHLGHAYTTIAADVATRHARRCGDDAFFLTGTDEHGAKVAQAAAAAGVSPKAVGRSRRRALPRARARDRGRATTSSSARPIPSTRRSCSASCERMRERGDLYESTYSGLYCTACEAFYTRGRPDRRALPRARHRADLDRGAQHVLPPLGLCAMRLLARYAAIRRSCCRRRA